MKKRKVKITKTGYLPDSPDRHNNMNIIPSNQITMKEVPFPILGIDNLGNKQTMMPGGEYNFPGDYVTEIPMGKYQEGGSNFKTKLSTEEEEQFKKFFQTLPGNLRSDDSMYDIRGYWDASGRPEEFDYSQPTQEDGYHHAFSRHPETGKILKAPTHPTFSYAVDKTPLGDDTYVPLIGVDGNVYMRDLNWDSQRAFEEDTYKQGGIYLGKYEFKDGGLVKVQEGSQVTAKPNLPDLNKSLSKNAKRVNKNVDNDSLLENVIEFADPTGITSWDDAKKSYNEWTKSGNQYPTVDQAVSMFGAVPALGKFGKIKYLDPESIKQAYKYIPWQQIVNFFDTTEDVNNDNMPNIENLPVRNNGGLVKAADGIEANFRRTSVDKSNVLSLQKELKNAGYDLGKSGKTKDGVDGVWGPKTEKAYRDFTNKKARMQTPVDSTEGPIFSEEDSTVFNEQIADTSSRLHNKALDNSLPEQVQQNNIKVADVPQYTESGLAVREGFQPLETEDKYAYGIKEIDTSIPADTLNSDQFYYESKRGVIDLPDGTKQVFTEMVPSQSIMGSASDVSYNPVEQETQAITEGVVDKNEYIVGKNKPNLFRESGTACTQDGKTIEACISGVQLGMDMNYKDIKRGDLGITGDSWEIGQNIIDKGGSRIYGLTTDLDLDPSQLDNSSLKNILDKEKKNKKVNPKDISSKSEVGDVVEMWYKNSDSQDKALRETKGNVFTTHAGIISEKDGVKYVTHNIHGTWHSDKLEDVIKGKGKVMVSGITRPNYKVDEKQLGVSVSEKPRYFKADDEERGLVHEDKNWKTKEGENGAVIPAKSTEANNYVQGLAYYAPQVQQDFKLSDNETTELMKLAFGVYGKESGFSHGETYTGKRKNRKLTKLYKDIAPDWMPEGDEMSSGPTQIKLDSNFNTDQEKALLQKYGIDAKNIWDEKTASAATLLEMARNYERFKQTFGVGFDNMDPITMRNVLALAHNKGIDNVLKNEFTDVSQAEKRNLIERAYDYATTDTTWSESKLKGTKRRDYRSLKSGLGEYANIHKNGSSYANLVQDYSQSLDVDYNKVKSNYWNTKTKPSYEVEHSDYTDNIAKASMLLNNTGGYTQREVFDPAYNATADAASEAGKYIGKGISAADRKIERGLKALEKKTRGAVNKVKKKVRMQDGGIYMGSYEFKDGGLVRMQEGGDMPFDLPLKEQNVYLVPEYNQPRNPETDEILPDPQRPNLGMDTGATEYKYTYGSDEGDIDVPSVVSGQYIGDQALDRYMLTGERFKTMNDPGSYSKFYDQIGELGLMQEKNGGSVRKVKIKSLPRKNQ